MNFLTHISVVRGLQFGMFAAGVRVTQFIMIGSVAMLATGWPKAVPAIVRPDSGNAAINVFPRR